MSEYHKHRTGGLGPNRYTKVEPQRSGLTVREIRDQPSEGDERSEIMITKVTNNYHNPDPSVLAQAVHIPRHPEVPVKSDCTGVILSLP
jgi:hypothetical protein